MQILLYLIIKGCNSIKGWVLVFLLQNCRLVVFATENHCLEVTKFRSYKHIREIIIKAFIEELLLMPKAFTQSAHSVAPYENHPLGLDTVRSALFFDATN